MSFVTPTDYIRYPYQGPMLRWQSDTVDLLITPDHRVVMQTEWAFDGTRDRSWTVVRRVNYPPDSTFPQAVRWSAPDTATVPLAGQKLSGDDYARFLAVWLAEGCTRERCADVVISQNRG